MITSRVAFAFLASLLLLVGTNNRADSRSNSKQPPPLFFSTPETTQAELPKFKGKPDAAPVMNEFGVEDGQMPNRDTLVNIPGITDAQRKDIDRSFEEVRKLVGPIDEQINLLQKRASDLKGKSATAKQPTSGMAPPANQAAASVPAAPQRETAAGAPPAAPSRFGAVADLNAEAINCLASADEVNAKLTEVKANRKEIVQRLCHHLDFVLTRQQFVSLDAMRKGQYMVGSGATPTVADSKGRNER
jgi:hypothetical protein